MKRRVAVSALLSILALSWLSCAAKESCYYPAEKARDIELNEEQAKAGAVILLAEDRIDIRNKDLCYIDYRQVKKILRSRQSDEGFFKFPDSEDYRIETIQARVKYPDGREEVLTELDIERLPDFDQFILYSDECSRMFEFSGLRPGTLIEVRLRYRIQNLALLPNILFQAQIPFLEKELILEHPADMNISTYAVCMDSDPDTVIALPDGRVQKRWRRTDVEPFEPESSMPPKHQYMPSLWISIPAKHELGTKLDLTSWQGVADWYADLSERSMECGSRIGALVAREKLPGRSEEDVARAIYHTVQRDFRYVAIYLGLGGYEPHDAELTAEKLYGDCKDQSVVLATALREAGIETNLVLVRMATLGRYPDPPPMFGYFNHVIVVADLDGRDVYMDPTCKTCSFGVLPHVLQGAHALVVDENDAELIELPFGGTQKNICSTRTTVRIRGEGEAVLRDTISCNGYFSEIYRGYFENREGLTAEEVAKKLFLDDQPFAEVIGFEMIGEDPASDSLVMLLEARIPEYADRRKTIFLKPIVHAMTPRRMVPDERKYPRYLGARHEMRCEIYFELPGSWRLVDLPDPLVVEDEFISFEGRYEQTEKGFRLCRKRGIRKSIVPLKSLSGFEDRVREIGEFEDTKVLIRRI